MNVVVGANASGKSNLIEAFRLLKKIYVDKDPFPFLEWWGYNNVVWQRKEELPIIMGLLFDIEEYDVYFETSFTGTGGKFQIFKEVLDIRGFLKFEKEGEWLTIKHDVKASEYFMNNLNKYETSKGAKIKLKKIKGSFTEGTKLRVGSELRLFEYASRKLSWTGDIFTDKNTSHSLMLSVFKVPKESIITGERSEEITILCPAIECEEELGFKEGTILLFNALYTIAANIISLTFDKQLILYPLNIRLMKVPQQFRREETIKEDGTNLASVYHTIYLKEGKVPEEIYNPLSLVFPKIDVRPHITDDGRVMIKFFENGFDLLPPNTSDGIYKILTVLIAIYLKPPLLIIDEIENSLHPETLELILDTIKASDIQAIITTHSPVVVDMTEPDDMILVEKERGESRFKRIKDPDKIRDFLKEKGITFSTGWLYGEISHIE
ncbi:MAG: ATP-binding protein [Candidatus Methanoperedens nitroreducens]|nr:ATP-binding protein [Candidatus Methanoperedens nitroreducens]